MIDRRSALGWILGLVSLGGERAGRAAALPATGLVAAVAGGCSDQEDSASAALASTAAAAAQAGGAVFNVRDFGALGDDRHDDTEAFQRAIGAAGGQRTGDPRITASSGQGGVVYVPQGVYRVRATLELPSGVSLRGAGMHTSQILFSVGEGRDGLVWSTSDRGPFGVGGFLEDIDIKAPSYNDATAARDLVVVSHYAHFAINRVRIIGASRHNLRINNSVNISAFHLFAKVAGTSNLWVGASRETVTTTCRFVGCYFQDSLRGPGADVAGLGITFDSCVFEGAGSGVELREAGEGHGIRIRGGTATLTAPYFEANRAWELLAATDEVPPDSTWGASVTVINPVLMPHYDGRGAPVKAGQAGGFKFERGSAFIQGGNFNQMRRPLVFGRRMDLVQAAASLYPHVPEVEGGTLAQLPGTVLYKKPATGQVVQAGNVVYGRDP